jgi:hypothetical protein
MNVSRRDLMRLAPLTVLGTATASVAGTLTAPSATAASPQWAGHKPGRIYLGVSSDGELSETTARTGPVGLQRTYHKWDDGSREDKNIRADHAAGRLPWISFKPRSISGGGWAAIAAGTYDADIRARARRYAQFSAPVIVTFNHEPQNDSTGTPADFVRAWTRIHDVMANETSLTNVVSAPIIGEWAFNPKNTRDEPGDFLTQAVLDRCAFVGIDLYQNRSGEGYPERLGRVLSWLDGQGHPGKMVGVGETGCTDSYGSPSSSEWWSRSWNWAVANSNRVGAISYFNSLHNNNSGNNWLLWDRPAKLEAFRASLSSPAACSLR